MARISRSLYRYLAGKPNPPNQYEALTATVYAFYPSRDFALYVNGQEHILTTVNNPSSIPLSAHKYADIGFLEAVYYNHLGNHSAARIAYYDALSTWDGKGFKDVAFHGQYQTYKVALLLYASRLLGISHDSQAFYQLVNLQASSGADKGGFYTCYDSSGKAACGTNTETTGIAILALSLPDASTTNAPSSWTQELIMLLEVTGGLGAGLLAVGLVRRWVRR